MANSRMRTILGLGLVLVGSLFLLRALAAPIAFVAAGDPLSGGAADQIELRARQQAQLEIQRAELEIQRARLEIQRELGSGSDVAPLPPLPPLPPMPPARPFLHAGAWLNPAVVLFALLLLVLWRRSRAERAAQ